MADLIPDPAGRLTPEFVAALRARYASDRPRPASLDADDLAERYRDLCDLVVQLLWPERYGVDPSDPLRHTSGPARAITNLIMEVAGVGWPS